MNKQDLINKINTSSITEERKAAIMTLINDSELNIEIIDQIKDIIQDDIDEGVTDILSDDQKKQIQDIENEGSDAIKQIATDIVNDLNFVENEMNDLDQALNTLTPVLDQIAVDEIKTNLDQAST